VIEIRPEAPADVAALGEDLVVVPGHPHYHPRSGFVPAATKDVSCEYPVPDDVFNGGRVGPGRPAGPHRPGEVPPGVRARLTMAAAGP
jgi:predicted N-acetyltransferase YhbS